MYFHRLKRFVLHLFRSGCLVIGLEHFLVMFPSAILIARLSNTEFGSIVELPAILFACGIGTIILLLLTKGKAPLFLGPSFSFIGFLSYQVASIHSPDDVNQIRSIVFLGYIVAAIILFILSIIYRFDKVKKAIRNFFPPTVMGPAISLIGLELADIAAQDSGFAGNDANVKIIALVTLAAIIVFSLLRHHFLQNASILIGIIIGCFFATQMGYFHIPSYQLTAPTLPEFYFLSIHFDFHLMITLILTVFPCAMIAFVESLGRVAVYEGMLKRDEIVVHPDYESKLILKHSITNFISSFLFMMPNAIYAENLAVMNLHNTNISTKNSLVDKDNNQFVEACYSSYSWIPYGIAALLSIIVALSSYLKEIFINIPAPILGGMELFIFGLISAPGIQLLVEEQIDYKKISNQIITASVFLAGISDINIQFGALSLHGMSLGLTIGVIVNLITIGLRHIGFLNEKISMLDLVYEGMDLFREDAQLFIPSTNETMDYSEFKMYMKEKTHIKQLEFENEIHIKHKTAGKEMIIHKKENMLYLTCSLKSNFCHEFRNDNSKIRTTLKDNLIEIEMNEYVSKHLLNEIFHHFA